MTRSAVRSGIINKWDYRSMLVGNAGYVPAIPSVYFPGEGFSTTVNKMPYSTETFTAISSTVTSSVYYYSTAFNNGREFGFVISGGTSVNKLAFPSDSISTATVPSGSLAATYQGGNASSAGWFAGNTGSTMSTSNMRSWSFSTDSVTTTTPFTSYTNIGPYNNYTFSNDPTVYFGGGTPQGAAYYGGLVKLNTSTSTASSLLADTTPTQRAYTSGAVNGTTAGYVGGGGAGPYLTYTASMFKVTFATDTSYSTLSATLSAARYPARVGIQPGVCAYYAGGKSTGGSGAASLTTVDKLTFSTETRSAVSTASVNRDGLVSWST